MHTYTCTHIYVVDYLMHIIIYTIHAATSAYILHTATHIPKWSISKICSTFLSGTITNGREVSIARALTYITECHTKILTIPETAKTYTVINTISFQTEINL